MKFSETTVAGALLIELEPQFDERGGFARAYCRDEFAAQGISMPICQINLVQTHRSRTLRGLHYQVAPATEAKLVRCVRGAAFDVLVDLRIDSPTYLNWFGTELSASNGHALYVPPLCAHGYMTLQDDTDMFYLVSEPYTPGAERGARFDDPAFNIEWPFDPVVLSDKDQQWDAYVPVC